MAGIEQKIKHADPEIKKIFDEQIPLPAGVTFFVFENENAGMWRLMAGIIISCMILGFPASWFTTHSSPASLDLVIGIGGTILMFAALIWFLKLMHRKEKERAMDGRYRCGVFFFSDKLVVRNPGSSHCNVVRKNTIGSARIGWFSSSDSSDQRCVSINYSCGNGKEKEFVIGIEFMFGYTCDEVLAYTTRWLNGPNWLPQGMMTNNNWKP